MNSKRSVLRLHRIFSAHLLATLACALVLHVAQADSTTTTHPQRWWSDQAESALSQTGTNRAQILKALQDAPQSQREGIDFIVANMPEPDLQTLSSDYLLENLKLAYEGFEKAPWKNRIPKAIFLNDILPYASVNESRDSWRRQLRELCAPMIEGATTPTEAVQKLNVQLFKQTGVGYNTKRRAPNQGPLETLQSKMATCTGLSILLVDACRSLGIPARVVGTPLWFNKRGNHTWIEIWDGDWHFTGAAEPDPKGLNRGWFNHDASQAVKDIPEHAIYASSFAKTGTSFPMVWARSVQYVSAVNVTDRYTPRTQTVSSNEVRLLVKVLDQPAGQRVPVPVTVTDAANAKIKFEGSSRGESADLNDILPFNLPLGRTYEVRIRHEGRDLVRTFTPGTNRQELLLITLKETAQLKMPSQICYARPPAASTLKPRDEAALTRALTRYFAATPEKQSTWKFSRSLEKLLQENEIAVRQTVWKSFQNAPFHLHAKADYATNVVRNGQHVSPYTVRQVGQKPAAGWPLFIAMHGGGGVPKNFNDSQWKHMQVYYKDHPEAGGYLYLALRAPNDSWNGFYDVYVYPLIENLIEQFVLFGEVDPNKVFIMGYSHGGYGAFAIGPKLPDRFAAIHASAAAPTDGETSARNLRNTRFTAMVGEKDTDYGRYKRNIQFQDQIRKLRGERSDIYPVSVAIIEGNGHTGLPDRDKITEMYTAVRQPTPSEITWEMTDNVVKDFFWLRCEAPVKKGEITARISGNHLVVQTSAQIPASSVRIYLDPRLVRMDSPLQWEHNGKPAKPLVLKPSLKILCETLQRRGDPDLAFTTEIRLAAETP